MTERQLLKHFLAGLAYRSCARADISRLRLGLYALADDIVRIARADTRVKRTKVSIVIRQGAPLLESIGGGHRCVVGVIPARRPPPNEGRGGPRRLKRWRS